MPLYYIDTVIDGIKDHDREGITFDNSGQARACVVLALLDLWRERPKTSEVQAVSAIARDDRGATVYAYSAIFCGGPIPRSPDEPVHRAIGAMNRMT